MHALQRFKRLLAMVLVLAMCLSLIPGAAFAAEEEKTFVRVTDAATLKAGGNIVLVAAYNGAYYALDTTIANKITPVNVTKDTDVSTLPLWTAAPCGDGISLSNGSRYLKNISSTNFTGSTAAAEWTVTEEGTDTFRFINKDRSSYGIGWNYNSGNPRFGTYATSNASRSDYVFDLMIFMVTAGSGEVPEDPTEAPTEPGTEPSEEPTEGPTEPGTEPSEEPTEGPAEPTEGPAEPEVPAGAVWTKVELADIQPTDTIAITMTGDGTTWVLPVIGEGSSKQPLATGTGTIADGRLTTGAAENYSWTIAATEGGFHISAGGNYLYVTAANNGVRIGATAAAWNVTDGYLASTDSNGDTRYLGVYNSQDWRCYKNLNTIGGQALSFWKLGGGEAEPEVPGIADGDYVIWAPAHSTALSSRKSGYYNLSVSVAEADGKLTGPTGTEIWTVNGNADGTVCLSQNGQNLGMADSYTSLNLGEVNDKWTLAQNSDGTWTLVNAVRGNTLLFSSYGTWSADATVTEAARAALKFTPASDIAEKEDEPQQPGTPDGTAATLVTDTSTLKAGDRIIIVASGSNAALGTQQKTNNRGQAEVTKSEDGITVTFGEGTQVITLETGLVDDTFAFSVGNGYLYAAGQSREQSGSSNKNHLKTESTLSGNSSWAIEIDAGGIATVKAQGSNGCNWLRHNAASALFSCYVSGQNDISIYKLSGEEEQPAGPVYTETLNHLDKVYIYWPAGGMVLSDTANGSKLTGVTGTVTGNYLEVTEGMTELIVAVDGNGSYSFLTADGRCLTSGTTGNSLSFEKASSGCSLWALEPAEDGWFIRNVNAAYNGSAQYMEYYNGFTTYGKNDGSDASVYTFRFYKSGEAAVLPETGEEPEQPAILVPDGRYVLWVGGEFNKALSASYPNGSYYNAGVDVTMEGDKLSGYGASEIWTVTNNANGTITLSMDGQNLGMADSYASMTMGAIHDKWILTPAGDGRFYVMNAGRSQYIQWRDGTYNYFSCYYLTENDNFAIHFTPAEEIQEEAPTALTDGTYVIWVPGYGKALSSEKVSTYYNKGVNVILEGDRLSGYGAAEIWDVKVAEDGSVTISQNGRNLGMAASNSNMDLDAVNDVWELTALGDGLYNVKNLGRGNYMEWYNQYGNWSTYNSSSAATDPQFRIMFTPAEAITPVDSNVVADIARWSGGYTEEAAAGLNAYGDRYTDGDKQDSAAILTVVAKGRQTSPYYLPGTNGYMGGVGIGSAAGDYIQMSVNTAGWGGMTLSFNLRASGSAAGSFRLMYSVDGGSTWQDFTSGTYSYAYYNYGSQTNVSGSGKITDGTARTSLAYDSFVAFTFDLPAAAENRENVLIRLVPGSDKANGKEGAISSSATIRMNTVVLSGSPILSNSITSWVTVTPNGADDQPAGTALTMECATDGAVISYRMNGGQWQTYDPGNKPTLETLPCSLEVKASCEGRQDSVTLLYTYAAGTVSAVKMTPNGGGVYIPENGSSTVELSCSTQGASIWYATSEDGTVFTEYVLYESPILLEDGFTRLCIKAYATLEGYNDSSEVTRTFTERESEGYRLFFGQLHSHTSISDGAGSVEEAFSHAYNVDNLDFLAVTDHSNSFDNADSGSLSVDGSAISSEWALGRETALKYTDDTFVGLYGFEMTWSGGSPGHMNTFNTPGWQSRTQSEYATKTSTDLINYFGTLATVPESISQFNHPGTTFGDFYDFGYYSESADSLVTLIEVGNGEGAIGSSGYFPSYEYYTRALDKGWHVAPTNNQDNHKGNWGDSNTGRTVVMTDALTEECIYDALRNYRVYATEDNDLSIFYSLDGNLMGSILDASDVGETVTVTVNVSDPTDSHIGKVEVIVNGGLSAASQTLDASSGTVTLEVPAKYAYYYIKITQADGDIAVTAPVWVGNIEAVGISGFAAESPLTVSGQEQTFRLDLFNNERGDLVIDSIVFTDKATGDVIFTETGIASVKKESTAVSQFTYTFENDGIYTITATVTGTLNGEEKTYTKDLEITVMPAAITGSVIVDGTHNNDYVSGYYAGNMGNMAAIAAAAGIHVTVETDRITPEMLENCDLLIISAPAKKTDANKTYEAKPFGDGFIAMVADYVKAGGSLIVCGLADYQDRNATFGTDGHAAAQLNKLLTAVGSTMRINDDEAYDDANNGGQAYRLYPETFNTESPWTAGLADTQVYSQYSGCTVDAGSGTWLVKGFDTTYSIDSDKDGTGGVVKGEAILLAAEETGFGGTVFVSGGVFMSNYEVTAELDNVWDLPYANRTIFENILGITRAPAEVTPIARVRASAMESLGRIFVVEGYVTSGTDNPNTTFFDAIYIQDSTGGITVFPYSEAGLELGTKVRITGFTDAYQGDLEIQIISCEILDAPGQVIAPEMMSNADAMDYTRNGGKLLQVRGEVMDVELSSDGRSVSQFVVKDEQGDLAKVFIDGYILSGTTGSARSAGNNLAGIVKKGNIVSAVGLLYLHPEGDSAGSVAVLRVRNCDEVVLIREAEEPTEPTDPSDPTESADPTEPPADTEPTEGTECTEGTGTTQPSEATDPTETTQVPETGESTETTGSGQPSQPGDSTNAPTGDASGVVFVMFIMMAAFAALAILLLLWKKLSIVKD